MDPDDVADNFKKSGPTVPPVDWTSPDYRRIVAASLVNGAYVLEKERNRPRRTSLAPEWWQSFDFERLRVISDDNNCIVGAIFVYSQRQDLRQHGHAPRFVVAFRGTIVKTSSLVKDLINNVRGYAHNLHKSSGCKIATEAVKDLVSRVNGNSGSTGIVWLAGHSLGSSVAMVVGKRLITEKDTILECFLFDPPYVESLSKMMTGKLKGIGEKGSRFKRYVKEKFVEEKEEDDEGSTTTSVQVLAYSRLSEWTPRLFVNPNDSISNGFIRHFKYGNNRSVGQTSFRKMFYQNLGKEYDPVYLLPSGNLILNEDPYVERAHGIKQWWAHNMNLNETKHVWGT